VAKAGEDELDLNPNQERNQERRTPRTEPENYEVEKGSLWMLIPKQGEGQQEAQEQRVSEA
jgi:hypothetical protein